MWRRRSEPGVGSRESLRSNPEANQNWSRESLNTSNDNTPECSPMTKIANGDRHSHQDLSNHLSEICLNSQVGFLN